MKNHINNSKKQGQALVTLLIFIVIAVTITSATTVVSITNALSSTKFEQGVVAYTIAESGIENAILRLLRNPNYTGETLTVGEGTAIVTVTGNPKIITSTGTVGDFSRKIQVVTGGDMIINIVSWKEIP